MSSYDSKEKIEVIEGITLLPIDKYWECIKHIKPLRERWWLRDPGILDGTVLSVNNPYRFGIDSCDVRNPDTFVRPTLEIKAGNLSAGEVFQFGGYEWTVISKTLALCDTGFYKMPFRENGKAKDANDYEHSDIKPRLEGWLREQELLIGAVGKLQDEEDGTLKACKTGPKPDLEIRKPVKRHKTR